VLPGSASDEVFVRSAFDDPLRSIGVPLHAPPPWRGAGVVDGYRRALDDALDQADGPLLVGGVSLGAQVAVRWAAGIDPRRLAGLLLVLPAWGGVPGPATPAAAAARLTAAQARTGGPAAAVTAARAGTPTWLGDELARAWTGYGAALADTLDAAAAEPGPTDADLAGLDVPAGVVGMTGDAVHPLVEARRWRALLPTAVLHTTTLDAFGADPAVLGRAAVLGWLQASAQREEGPERLRP
jgi:pimeloyl-ACP methyl ester carboxylesterase